MSNRNLACGAAIAVMAFAAASAVYAQSTTGGVNGRVTNEAGQPVPRATVVIPHEPTVTATRVKNNMGPQTRVGLRDLDTLPSLNRDVKDAARTSPYVLLDPTNNNALLIGGQNNRSNSITIDGVKQTDDFGLQANGYPT